LMFAGCFNMEQMLSQCQSHVFFIGKHVMCQKMLVYNWRYPIHKKYHQVLVGLSNGLVQMYVVCISMYILTVKLRHWRDVCGMNDIPNYLGCNSMEEVKQSPFLCIY
jgi:hypothetical protein